MYHVKDDPRSIKSAKMLYDGLAQLIQEKPLYGISVTNLVEASNVGRTTFYRHFDQIEDILRWQSDQVFEDMIQHVIAYAQQYGNESRVMLLKPVLRYFYTRAEFVELLIQVDRLDIAMASFHQAVKHFRERARLHLEIDEAYVEYGMTVQMGIVMNIVVHWIDTGMQQPPDEVADTLVIMIKHMVTIDQLL